jgi:hypothetical protein
VSDIHVNSSVESSSVEPGKSRRSSFKEGVMADAAAVVAAREGKGEGAGGKASRRMSRRASLQTGGATNKSVSVRLILSMWEGYVDAN